MTEAKTHTLDVPGAVLTYDVREATASTEPLLLMIGSPMGATASPAWPSTSRTVRSSPTTRAAPERSKKADDTSESTPDEHADDLHRLIDALGAGPVDLFATSGGAVNALALVARHPEQVRTLVAHEPPAAQVLPDREAALAAVDGHPRDVPAGRVRPGDGEVHRAGQPRGPGPGRLRREPRPGPGRRSGCRPRTTARVTTRCSARTSSSCNYYEHDFDALRAASTRIVLGVGAESKDEFAHRAGAGRRRAARHARRSSFPEQPRRLHRRRVTASGRPRRLRRHPPPGPGERSLRI